MSSIIDSPIRQLYIGFDGGQLEFSTDVEEAAVFTSEAFRHMLVPLGGAICTTVSMFQSALGYTIRGEDSVEYQAGDLKSVLPFLKDEVRLQFMRYRPDLLWLHSAAVEKDGRALLIAGRSGQGKSTLSTRLCERGWRYLSDDIAPVRMESDRVVPFPQTPVRRIPVEKPVADEEIASLTRETVHQGISATMLSDAKIESIVFVQYEAGCGAILQQLKAGSAALELLRNLTNFIDHKASAVEKAAGLALRIPAYSLSWSDPFDAAALLDRT